jgi:hypothetical protein
VSRRTARCRTHGGPSNPSTISNFSTAKIIGILDVWKGEVEDAQMMIDGRDQLDGYDLVANFD